ncbi:hypothetical protein Cob_v013054 [Colletotrichum orbiculare MAFF 240422]|uniref:Uncharacterized protein n=1 Tax=Colletotrichum orbiculare (strain 104-T / ATCC 96160 / CBS 514.97 / LARS 414 / MAFF 240422) TaxID=1213857 RepID=N4V8C7_COLOR|nr:hypothetical protein Cob_v013054 [Colletotrichum orbiculare MAFF 240422]
MPWLSRASSYPSPVTSPRVSNSSPRSSPRTSPRSSLIGPIKNFGPSVTYIPPLIDGACGTVPLGQKPPLSLLQEDLREMWQMMPGLMASLRLHVANHRAHLSKSHLKDIVVQLSLAIVEVGMITLAGPLFIVLPGLFFTIWLAISLSLVYGLSCLMNGSNVVVNCDELGNSTAEAEEDEEKWIFIGGMGTSSTHLTQCTLPRLARLFGKSFSGIQMATYGLPFDMLLLAVQRCSPFQTQASRALYSELRTALLDGAVSRVGVLAHNNGTLPVAHVLSRLCADIQPEKLGKLEIYTFGAAASEFVVPLGESRRSRFDEAVVVDERGPHIEHFAYANDPFAQMGVLKAVNKKPDGRFCGGVYVIQNQIPQPSGHWVPDHRPVMLLTDYLSALFPDPSSPSAPSSILDYVMVVDRDSAERRELAAMANSAQTKRTRKDNRRRSWTGLGATVGGRNGVMDGVHGLEAARKGCRECEGHRGREISWLTKYVQTGWAVEKGPQPVDAIGIHYLF